MSTADSVIRSLEQYGLKKEGNGKYRCKSSPFRPGSDSNGFTLTVDADGEHGAWKDHAATDKAGPLSGSLYDLAKHLGIETQNGRVQIQTTKRKYNDLADYAKAHGADEQVFSAAGWILAEHDGRKCLQFPTGGGVRYRFIDGDSPTYKSQAGYKTCWYGLQRAIKTAKDKNLPLVICNGEASTVVAQSYDLPATATTGGESTMTDEQINELRQQWQGEVVIVFDCDPAGRAASTAVTEKLSPHFVTRSIDLGLSDGGDLADFCKLNTGNSLDKLRQLYTVNPPNVLQLNLDRIGDGLKALAQARREQAENNGIERMLSQIQRELDHAKNEIAPTVLVRGDTVAKEAYEEFQKMQTIGGAITGLACGIGAIDRVVRGFGENQTCTILGATSMGKSTLLASLAGGLLESAPGLIIPTESNYKLWFNKIVARNTRIPFDKISEGRCTAEEYQRVGAEMARLGNLPHDFLKKGSPNLQDIREGVARAVDEIGIKWVIIDSLSNLSTSGDGIYHETRIASKGIQSIAQDYPVAIIQSIQTGRNAKGRENKRPGINDAKGGGDVEEDADIVMGLYYHHYYVKLGDATPDPNLPENISLLTVAKHKWAPTAGKAVKLVFVSGSGFYEMAKEEGNHATLRPA